MTRITRYRGRMDRPRLVPVKFSRPGARSFIVYVEPGERDRLIEEYRLIGWELM